MFLKIITVILLSVLTLTVHAQRKGGTVTDNQNFLPMEGGGKLMGIDQITPLNELIERLAKDWYFQETNKMYWIGYTQDMYSIAAHGDEAIDALVEVLNKPKNSKQTYGAIYTLHLIGIDRIIAGRTYEEFVNIKARKALLKFLNNTEIQEDIMRLLIRDPWLSDLPSVISALESSEDDCWAIVAGLTNYGISTLPIAQTIPRNIQIISIPWKQQKDSLPSGGFEDLFDEQMKEALKAFCELKNENVVVEEGLFNQSLIGDFGSTLENAVIIDKTNPGAPVIIGDPNLMDIGDFTRSVILSGGSGYIFLGTRVQYFIEGNCLYFCTMNTAKERILAWWKNLREDEKLAFSLKNHKS
jgi:hypothetical protein